MFEWQADGIQYRYAIIFFHSVGLKKRENNYNDILPSKGSVWNEKHKTKTHSTFSCSTLASSEKNITCINSTNTTPYKRKKPLALWLWSPHELVKESPSGLNIKNNEQLKNTGLQWFPDLHMES